MSSVMEKPVPNMIDTLSQSDSQRQMKLVIDSCGVNQGGWQGDRGMQFLGDSGHPQYEQMRRMIGDKQVPITEPFQLGDGNGVGEKHFVMPHEKVWRVDTQYKNPLIIGFFYVEPGGVLLIGGHPEHADWETWQPGLWVIRAQRADVTDKAIAAQVAAEARRYD